MTSTSRNKGKNNNSNNNNNNNNNKRNTSNTKSQPKTHYVFGDVVFVVRRIAGLMDQALYHHAGIVTEVLDGEITQILHFDPLFDRGSNGGLPPWDLVKQSIVGVYSLPEFLDGEQLSTIFPPEDVHIEECGPQDPLEQAFVHSRIEQVRVEIMNDQKRLYQLHAYNCQHFAMQMRTGKAVSPDAASVFDSLKAGLNAGVESWRGRDEGAVDAGDWKSSVSGALSMLWDGGVAATQHYFSQVQNRRADAYSRQCTR